MHNYSALYRAAALLLLAATPPLCLAVDTHVWEQSDQSEFTRGIATRLSIRSDGHVTLAPEFKELDSTSVPYLWAMAEDSKGSLYYAGGAPTGATTKIFVLPPKGKPKVFTELTGLEVHVLAVDSQDNIYAAVLPDSKIYRIDKAGKAQLFFDPKCKYVWSMVFDHAGNLFVATGDAGLIYKVAPDGRGSKFFDTEETHARSMIIDDAGNLIVGTEPGGLVLRITPKGESFVLYQTNKREVTAVAEHNGVIYAAAVANKSGPALVTGAPPVLPANPSAVTPTGAPRTGTTPPALPPAIGSIAAAVSGGSDFYRIQKDGFAERIWNSSTDLVYAIAFDASGKPLLGTGNKGFIYRVDSDQLSTQLLNAPPTQVTAFLQGKNGIVYAATGNVGNLYSIGPGIDDSGTLASEVLDANDFAYWGKAHHHLKPARRRDCAGDPQRQSEQPGEQLESVEQSSGHRARRPDPIASGSISAIPPYIRVLAIGRIAGFERGRYRVSAEECRSENRSGRNCAAELSSSSEQFHVGTVHSAFGSAVDAQPAGRRSKENLVGQPEPRIQHGHSPVQQRLHYGALERQRCEWRSFDLQSRDQGQGRQDLAYFEG